MTKNKRKLSVVVLKEVVVTCVGSGSIQVMNNFRKKLHDVRVTKSNA